MFIYVKTKNSIVNTCDEVLTEQVSVMKSDEESHRVRGLKDC